VKQSPYGEYFTEQADDQTLLFVHGGWGKVSAAASTQYVIDHFKPARLINIGTCGVVEGRIRRFDVVVPDRLIIMLKH
jgi:adenosylhomocysteine nucleosidase